MSVIEGDRLHTVSGEELSKARIAAGRVVLWGSALVLLIMVLVQALHSARQIPFGFENWRPVLYAYFFWAFALCVSRVLIYGEQGKKALFVLPAVLFVVSMVVFPLVFGLYISFTDWNLSSLTGRKFNGLDNVRQMWTDPFYWNALRNMVVYVFAILAEYAVAFGLAMLLNAQIVARKFWRVIFLLPLMLSPVAISWMIGKSMMEVRFGPLARLARWLGWENPSFFGSPEIAKLTIMLMDAWNFIPFMMIMILAGLQALPKEVLEAAKVDGASAWQSFWRVTFPLMLPVSVTAIMIRIIFKLKLADIIINVTAGGPGGATDSVTSFIFREYRDRSNVGYGTLLAMFYLVLIVIFMTALLKISDRIVRRATGTG
ncbi:carbohydrate ABC transporter permease [Oricola cellulosilytica]|uniref:Sugar ABC transporter permease n=1 Tax=Oricola cellulosilytica TaxID=1429082 RepID=A0A4R0P7L4_9HYPH|nr:sugar ABC transporter permease [Oricola cellulosilytica]TCD13059.1 sugar ABC transporter permease [Oricola cellulosilytica]